MMISENKINTGEICGQLSACTVVAVFADNILSFSASKLEQKSNGYLSGILRRNYLSPDIGSTLLLPDVPAIAAASVLLVRCGNQAGVSTDDFHKITESVATALLQIQVEDALLYLSEVQVIGREAAWKIRQLVERFNDSCYQFNDFKSAPGAKIKICRLDIGCSDPDLQMSAEGAIAEARAISMGKLTARTLADAPPNICTPEFVAAKAMALAKAAPAVQLDILGREEMRALGMNALLAVDAAGSHEGKLVLINYRGAASDVKPVVMVGKGITFDSGGLSLKERNAMTYMKYDMCGAAAVLGALAAVVELRLAINVIGVLVLAENMPDSNAIKPGDIVTTMAGKTVEILNTDAEGRLILCDALTYVKRFDPKVVIDVATLTGACSIALGPDLSGLFCTDEKLSEMLCKAAESADDHVWRLPIHNRYDKYLESKFADMANVGIKQGGSIIAACFLRKFTDGYPWAHLDIAGTACDEAKKKGATGRPVPLLTQYLIHCASK